MDILDIVYLIWSVLNFIMIQRKLFKELVHAAKSMPIVSLSGPRQSGKTTLVKAAFPEYSYFNLENQDTQIFARQDPRGFLSQGQGALILDEVQNVPTLFSYLQTFSDERKTNGQFILTGSQNFLLMEKVSQSLAGRVSLHTLLPFSISEINGTKYDHKDYESVLFKGFYPRIYDQELMPGKWLANYTQTYIERDVRKIINVGDLSTFQLFLKCCASRNGQLVNLTNMSNELGVSYQTVKRWISVLEASYIIFLVPPYYKNFNKRIIKTPKLYFYDPGLVSYLLGIQSSQQINSHYIKGELFEGFILSEIKKYFFNNGLTVPIYYWRNKTGKEIDCIIEYDNKLFSIEIKSGRTIRNSFFDNLLYWQRLTGEKPENSILIYGGDEVQHRSVGRVYGWKHNPIDV